MALALLFHPLTIISQHHHSRKNGDHLLYEATLAPCTIFRKTAIACMALALSSHPLTIVSKHHFSEQTAITSFTATTNFNYPLIHYNHFMDFTDITYFADISDFNDCNNYNDYADFNDLTDFIDISNFADIADFNDFNDLKDSIKPTEKTFVN